MLKILTALAVAAATLIATQAHAATTLGDYDYRLSFTDGAGDSAKFDMFTAGKLTAATPQTILFMTGTLNGLPITFTSGEDGSSDILYRGYPFFDYGGVALDNGVTSLIVYARPGVLYSNLHVCPAPCDRTAANIGIRAFTYPSLVTPTPVINYSLSSAAPEPTTWAMTLLGLAIVSLGMRRSRA